MSGVPLVVITADRPPEHQDWGVGQAFDQRGLFARHVRSEVTMPVGGEGGARFSVRAGWRAAVTAASDAGPVHVNWAFRLPLEPAASPIERAEQLATHSPISSEHATDVESFLTTLDSAESPVVVAGPDTTADPVLGQALVDAAANMGIPILRDVLSGLPHGASVLGAPGLLVDSASTPSADLVIRLGDTPTAKSVRMWWERARCPHVLIDPLARWHDPSHMVSMRLTGAPSAYFVAASQRFTDRWDASAWSRVHGITTATIDSMLARWPTTTEAHVARDLAEASTPGDIIVASSSMPVRDLDVFGADTPARVLANRGINGIDGVIATAHGVALAQPNARVSVLIGDVATIHDIGGLLSAARAGVSLRIIIVNNDGGGIFSRLPIRDALDDAQFETLFHTPHGTTFSFLEQYPGITYVETTDVPAALRTTANSSGVVVIEVPVDTPERLHFAEALRNELTAGAA